MRLRVRQREKPCQPVNKPSQHLLSPENREIRRSAPSNGEGQRPCVKSPADYRGVYAEAHGDLIVNFTHPAAIAGPRLPANTVFTAWGYRVPDLSSVAAIGSIPQWGLLVAVVVAVFKIIPTLRAQTIEGKQQDADTWRSECTALRAELRACEEDCDRRLKKLEADLWGEKRQRVTEQISFINIILQSVDAPELKTMLTALESVEAKIRVQHALEAERNGGGK